MSHAYITFSSNMLPVLDIYVNMNDIDCRVQQKNPIEAMYALQQATNEAEKRGPQYATSVEALTKDAFYKGEDINELAKAFVASTFLFQLSMQESCKTKPVHEVAGQLYQETINLGLNPPRPTNETPGTKNDFTQFT